MRRRIAVEVDGSIFVLRGWQAHKLAVEAGLRPTFNGVRQGWVADTSKLSTFEAYCAHRRVPLEVEAPATDVTPDAPAEDEVDSDLPLFDLGGR